MPSVADKEKPKHANKSNDNRGRTKTIRTQLLLRGLQFCHGLSQGLKTLIFKPTKSLTLRVATVRSCSRAVAAKRPSMIETGVPRSFAKPASNPHRSAIVSVTGNT